VEPFPSPCLAASSQEGPFLVVAYQAFPVVAYQEEEEPCQVAHRMAQERQIAVNETNRVRKSFTKQNKILAILFHLRLHHSWCRATNATHRTRETSGWTTHARRCRWKTTSGGTANTRTTHGTSASALLQNYSRQGLVD